MTRLLRIAIIAIALVEGVAWTLGMVLLKEYGRSIAGMSASAVSPHESGADSFFTAAIWLLLTSPYICMVLGCLGALKGTLLRVAYWYSLVVLAITTTMLLITFQQVFELMALG